MPGPHVFSVRFNAVRLTAPQRPPHPAPRFVTLRNAPLSGRDQITIILVQIAVKRYLRKTENNLCNSEPVIPGLERTVRPLAGPLAREPGIHNHGLGLWIPGLRLRPAIAGLSRIPE